MNSLKRFAIACAVVGAIGMALLSLSFLVLTGSPWPLRHIEALNDPVDVTRWTPAGLQLADGRTVQLPGFTRLPEKSVALRQVTSRGVEIDRNGRVIGLVSIFHGCGNDPVWTDIRRIDLALLLAYLREGKNSIPVLQTDRRPFGKTNGGFGPQGWSDSYGFESFLRTLADRGDLYGRKYASAWDVGYELPPSKGS